MPSPRDVNEKATRESRAKGGQARAEKIRAQKEEQHAMLAAARAEHLDEAIETLSVAAKRAAETIAELLEDDASLVRLRAAVALLEILDAAELRELSDRLERLEDIAAGRNGKP
jgi:HEAT repeat protein